MISYAFCRITLHVGKTRKKFKKKKKTTSQSGSIARMKENAHNPHYQNKTLHCYFQFLLVCFHFEEKYMYMYD
jgi:hypothetical protein